MLKDMFCTWHNLKSEMQKEANKLSCDEASLKLASQRTRRLHGGAACHINRKANHVIPNSKGGKK
jgi:hypothetical protein